VAAALEHRDHRDVLVHVVHPAGRPPAARPRRQPGAHLLRHRELLGAGVALEHRADLVVDPRP
jgi:hypothetical protein